MIDTHKTKVHVKTGKRRKNTVIDKSIRAYTQERFTREADIREKRINIVFKVIYVIAAFFAAIFTIIAGSYDSGLTDTYILFTSVDGFLLCLLAYMLGYIFNELKCLKLHADGISNDQYQRTEDAYSFIFTYFVLGAVIALIYGSVIGCYHTVLPKMWFPYVVCICSPVAALLGNQLWSKIERASHYISCILWTIVAISVLMGIAVK